jgi:hypothetical protein
MMQHVAHPQLGSVPMVRNPMLSNEEEREIAAPAPPLLGEHSRKFAPVHD